MNIRVGAKCNETLLHVRNRILIQEILMQNRIENDDEWWIKFFFYLIFLNFAESPMFSCYYSELGIWYLGRARENGWINFFKKSE